MILNKKPNLGTHGYTDVINVVEVYGAKEAVSTHDGKTLYKEGIRVFPDKWCENWQEECSSGIHFFITKIEAENY